MTTHDPHDRSHTTGQRSTDRPRSLRYCHPGDVVTTELGEIVVMLHPTSTGRPRPQDDEPSTLGGYDLVEVYATHRVVHLPADAVVTPVTDPTEQLCATRAAVDALAFRRRVDVQTQDTLRAEHARVMADIRAFAIERHLTGDTGAEELNEFLVHFGLPAYQPRLQVRFTITGSYEVTGEPDTIPAAGDQARRHLSVHFDDVDDLVHGSQAVRVHVDDVTPLDG